MYIIDGPVSSRYVFFCRLLFLSVNAVLRMWSHSIFVPCFRFFRLSVLKYSLWSSTVISASILRNSCLRRLRVPSTLSEARPCISTPITSRGGIGFSVAFVSLASISRLISNYGHDVPRSAPRIAPEHALLKESLASASPSSAYGAPLDSSLILDTMLPDQLPGPHPNTPHNIISGQPHCYPRANASPFPPVRADAAARRTAPPHPLRMARASVNPRRVFHGKFPTHPRSQTGLWHHTRGGRIRSLLPRVIGV
ncbi:hypothetical protein BKA93DRAFT_2505 [Sparassis latifolia]